MPSRIAIVCALIACGLALFLRYETAVHEISGAASSCNISAQFDCDAVQTSVYAKLFGLSVSLLAAAGSALLAILLLLVARFGDGMRVAAGLLALANGLVSLVYLGISVFVLGVSCLYCNGIQALSVAAAVCVVPGAWRAAKAGIPARTLAAAALAGCLVLLFAVLGEAYTRARVELGQVREDVGGAGMRVDVCDALMLGDPDRGAENSYLVYFDFGCPKCRGCYGTAKAILKDHPDRAHFFFKHWPLDRQCNGTLHRTVHENACEAAKAGTVLAHLGHSAQALEALFNLDGRFTRKRLREVAERLGVGGAEWDKLVAAPDLADAIRRDVDEGNRLDFSGVPRIFRNGRPEREMRLPRR
jgi:uncharacterized membrane protein